MSIGSYNGLSMYGSYTVLSVAGFELATIGSVAKRVNLSYRASQIHMIILLIVIMLLLLKIFIHYKKTVMYRSSKKLEKL